MAWTLTPDEARKLDQLAAERLGLPGLVLMENAAINAAGAAVDLLDDTWHMRPKDAKVVVVCGGGNNGGDGMAMARHLMVWGVERLTVVLLKPVAYLGGDAAVQAKALAGLGVTLHEWPNGRAEAGNWLSERLAEADLVVDAMLGTGATGPLRPAYAQAVDLINAAADAGEAAGRGPVVMALDVPTGMDAGAGEVAGPAVMADLTMTFVALKAGFISEKAAKCLGRVVVGEIGVPVGWFKRAMAGS